MQRMLGSSIPFVPYVGMGRIAYNQMFADVRMFVAQMAPNRDMQRVFLGRAFPEEIMAEIRDNQAPMPMEMPGGLKMASLAISELKKFRNGVYHKYVRVKRPEWESRNWFADIGELSSQEILHQIMSQVVELTEPVS